MITLEHVSKTFTTKSGYVHAVRDVSLQIDEGEIYGIIGFSGAGKSTLVRCINLLERPEAGNVTVDGRELLKLDASQLRESRKKIGMIFQHFNLMRLRTVAQNVAFPLKKSGLSKEEIARKVKELLELAWSAAGDMIRHLRVEYLRLHYTFAGQPDPAKAALRCGKANISGGIICHLLEQHLNILRREVTAEVDFCSEQSTVYAAGSCSIRVGAALLVTLRLLRSYLQWKKRQGKPPAQEEKTYG